MKVTKTDASQNFGMLNIRKSVGIANYDTVRALDSAKVALKNLAGNVDIIVKGAFDPELATSGIRIIVSDMLTPPKNVWGKIGNAFRRFFAESESGFYSGDSSNGIISEANNLKRLFLDQKDSLKRYAQSSLDDAKNRGAKTKLIKTLTN